MSFAKRSRVTGVNKLRKTLNRVEPDLKGYVVTEIADVAHAVALDAAARAPREYGDLQHSITAKPSRDRLSWVIGPGAAAAQVVSAASKGNAFALAASNIRLSERNKDLLMQFFKGYWLEYGTKGGKASGKGPGGPIAPRPFMRPAWERHRDAARRDVRSAVNRALREAASR